MNRSDFHTFDRKDENNRRRGESEPQGEGEAEEKGREEANCCLIYRSDGTKSYGRYTLGHLIHPRYVDRWFIKRMTSFCQCLRPTGYRSTLSLSLSACLSSALTVSTCTQANAIDDALVTNHVTPFVISA